jgi:hypothetical protein
MVHYHVYSTLPLVSIVNQVNPVHALPSYSLQNILTLSWNLRAKEVETYTNTFNGESFLCILCKVLAEDVQNPKK